MSEKWNFYFVLHGWEFLSNWNSGSPLLALMDGLLLLDNFEIDRLKIGEWKDTEWK